MIDLAKQTKKIEKDQLINKIRIAGHTYITHRQVSNRLRELLHNRRIKIIDQLKDKGLEGQLARRQSYLSKDYLSYMNHLLNMRYLAGKSKVEYECGIMLLEARKSIEFLHRPQTKFEYTTT